MGRWVETSERVGDLGGRLTRRGAERLRAKYPPLGPWLRWEVEKVGGLRWERWRVVGYRNAAEGLTSQEIEALVRHMGRTIRVREE